MNLHRREFLQFGSAAALASLVSPLAAAELYPVRPVQIVAGFPPGSHADLYARLMGQALSERFMMSVTKDLGL